MLKPTFEVEVARPEMFNPRSVVVPVFEISRAEIDDVANVVGVDVEMKRDPPIERKVYILSESVPSSANCG